MNEKYSGILKSVSKPGRYSGGEYGQIIKDKKDVRARFAFCFPDTYEIGMSNLGVRILYGCLNREPEIWCERVYAPMTDMEEKMRELGMPLTAHESGDPVKDFDIVGFTLQYEMCYTNVLNMLDLAGIPLFAAERGENDPIIVGGGPCAYNAEPVADFFDCFSIGEGEEHLVELTKLYVKMKEDGSYSRAAFLHEAAKIPGTYVPSLYAVEYNEDGTVKSYSRKYDDIPEKVTKRIIKDLDSVYFPEKPVMPYIETVHDRIMLEVYRGCIRGCRFCQAGMVYRPVREKSPEVLCKNAKCLYETTGYDEISLTSLSISDYTKLPELCDGLLSWTQKNNVSLSLPSLRIDSFSKELMEKVESVRASTMTFAPEAGTQRMRDVINKNVTEEDLLRSVGTVFAGGKNNAVKLYFMQGLPTETLDDIAGIGELAEKVIDCFYHTEGHVKRPPQVTISEACFVPKPFTPFQWEAQDSLEDLYAKQDYLYNKITNRKIKYNHHDATTSRIEAALARGDRRMSAALYECFKAGMKFDAWTEHFSYENWVAAFERAGLDIGFYANRRRGDDEILPWEIIDCGVTREFLMRERDKAYRGETTRNCREQCSACGANKLGGDRVWCPGAEKKLK